MEYLQYLLQQYHTGKATAEERVQLLSMLEEQGTGLEQQLREEFADGVAEAHPSLPTEKASVILQQMHRRIQTAAAPAAQATVRRVWMKRLVWTAAAAVLLLIGGKLWWYQAEIAKQSIAEIAQTDSNEVLQLHNSTSHKDTLLLPDGSSAVLYPGSTLSYAKHFHSQYRSLNLQGEACFSVAKDTRRPFTVYAHGIATTALGTRFNVSTEYDGQVRVRLLEGKVVVQEQEQRMAMHPVYLKPGEECWVNRISGTALVKNFGTSGKNSLRNTTGAGLFRHTEGLEFTREPLANVFKRLEKEYHVSITYPGTNIGRLSFTGTFLPTDSLPVVLTIICKTNDLAFEQKNGRIIITQLP